MRALGIKYGRSLFNRIGIRNSHSGRPTASFDSWCCSTSQSLYKEGIDTEWTKEYDEAKENNL